MSSQQKYVGLVVGTHTWNPEDEKVDKIVELMRKHGVKNMDTARVYVSSIITLQVSHNLLGMLTRIE